MKPTNLRSKLGVTVAFPLPATKENSASSMNVRIGRWAGDPISLRRLPVIHSAAYNRKTAARVMSSNVGVRTNLKGIVPKGSIVTIRVVAQRPRSILLRVHIIRQKPIRIANPLIGPKKAISAPMTKLSIARVIPTISVGYCVLLVAICIILAVLSSRKKVRMSTI